MTFILRKIPFAIAFLLALFFTIFFIDYSFFESFLIDDSALLVKQNFSDVFRDPNIIVRPFAGYLKASISHLPEHYLIHLANSLFFCLNLFLLYQVLQEILKNNGLALTIAIVVAFFPYSPATMFSATMIVSNFPISLFLIAVLLSLKKNILALICAFSLITISHLTYEINIFLLPIIPLIWLYRIHNKKRLTISTFLVLILPLAVWYVYKKYLAKLLFSNYYDYTSDKISFSFSGVLNWVLGCFKTFILDWFFMLKRSIIAIQYFSFVDYFLFSLAILISFLTIRMVKKVIFKISWKLFLSIFLLFILSNAIFLISNYSLNVYGFESRTMGWVRISFSLIFIFSLFYFIKNSSKLFVLPQIFLLLYLVGSGFILIAQKNAWGLAGNLNQDIVQSTIESNLLGKAETYFVLYDKYVHDFLVADEPSFKADYAFWNTLKFNGINKEPKLKIIKINNKNLDSFLGREFNKRIGIKSLSNTLKENSNKNKFPVAVINHSTGYYNMFKTPEELDLYLQTIE